jgi:hypothetical protein
VEVGIVLAEIMEELVDATGTIVITVEDVITTNMELLVVKILPPWIERPEGT